MPVAAIGPSVPALGLAVRRACAAKALTPATAHAVVLGTGERALLWAVRRTLEGAESEATNARGMGCQLVRVVPCQELLA